MSSSNPVVSPVMGPLTLTVPSASMVRVRLLLSIAPPQFELRAACATDDGIARKRNGAVKGSRGALAEERALSRLPSTPLEGEGFAGDSNTGYDERGSIRHAATAECRSETGWIGDAQHSRQNGGRSLVGVRSGEFLEAGPILGDAPRASDDALKCSRGT